MKNRALAADMQATLAFRRHDPAEAMRYAERSEQAGEDLVRFNPSDMASWVYWIRGRDQVAGLLFQQGRVSDSNRKLRETVALAADPRLPASLDPVITDAWFNLALQEAEVGQESRARAALASSAKAMEVGANLAPPDNPSRALNLARIPLQRSSFEIVVGRNEEALEYARRGLAELERISLDPQDVGTRQFYDNVLQFALGAVSEAQIRLGDLEDAEQHARQRLDMPPNTFGNPASNMANRQVILAYAVAMQGRGAEAAAILEPALAYYLGEKAGGASGTDFRRDLAGALYVSALTQGTDPAGQKARRQALEEAASLLAGLSPEARQLASTRELAGWIAAARG